MLSYLLYLFKKIQHKQDALLFLVNTITVYNFIANTTYNVKSSSQYQYEPILWKLNSILNDSTLSIYILIMIYTYILYNYKLKITKLTIILLAYVFIQTWKNQFIFIQILKITPYNTTLFNGLLLVHPVCLYLSYAYVLYVFTTTRNYKIGTVAYLSVLFYKKFFFLTFSLIALVLGCWWAQQEVSWGGWWNWDPIEIIALLVLMISLIVNHLAYKYQTLLFFFRPLMLIFVTTTYFVSRYDILNSIHSFALASTSQNYLEMKLIILYFIIYINSRRFFQNNGAYIFYEITTTICIIFLCYFTFIIATILYEIGLNNIGTLSITTNTNKNIYLTFFFILLLTVIFREISTALTFTILIGIVFITQNAYLPLTLILLSLVFKITFWKKVTSSLVYYKIIIIHLLLLVLMCVLIFYSNVEIFFTKPNTNLHVNKKFALTVVQYTNIKEHSIGIDYLTRTTSEPFFQKSSTLIRLLTQNIFSNINYNNNKINLSKTVLFVQNYLYSYGVMFTVSVVIWFTRIYKSGIV